MRAKLAAEEQQYILEMDDKEETTIERQAKMREKAKSLREKREHERLQFVDKMLDKQWREQCEELRSTLTKRHQDEVCAERMEQLRIKAEMDREHDADERMYADLWEQDRLNKAAREENESKEKRKRDLDTLDTLRMQMAALEAQKADEKKLKEEEAQLLQEQRALRKLEEQKALEEKRRRQKETHDMLDLSLRVKAKKQAKEQQEQLAFDMKMLEKLLEETRNEELETEQRKRELREEDRRYRDYLFQLMEEEKAREKELDKMIDSEVEKMWQKRLNQRRLEREARKRLLEDVLAGRKLQLQAKMAQHEKKKLIGQKERQELLELIEVNKRIEREQQEKIRVKHLRHQDDLLGQMDYNERQEQLRLLEERQEHLLSQEAEGDYQRRLKDALDRPFIDKVHPTRRRLMNSPII